jgi:hypothetical protein
MINLVDLVAVETGQQYENRKGTGETDIVDGVMRIEQVETCF